MIKENTNPAPAAPAAAPTSAQALAAPLIGDWPKATPGTSTSTPDAKDTLGRAFDAQKFAVDEAGKPRFDSRGRFINRNAGRKKTTDTPAASADTSPAPSAAPEWPEEKPAPGPDRYLLAADMYCRGGYAMADAIFRGKGEWAPDDDAEHVALRDTVAAYLRAKGCEDLPPGAALALAAGSYVAKRVQRPNTSTRIRLMSQWVTARFWSWRTGRKIEHLQAPEQPAAAPTKTNGTTPAAVPPPPAQIPLDPAVRSGLGAMSALAVFKEY